MINLSIEDLNKMFDNDESEMYNGNCLCEPTALMIFDTVYDSLYYIYRKSATYFPIKYVLYKYDVRTLFEKDFIEVNVVDKKGNLTGKRKKVRVARFVRSVFSFVDNTTLEEIASKLKESNIDINFDFHISEDFTSILDLKMTKETYFSTSEYNKSLYNSCMRHSKEVLELEYHPFEAYQSGDFEIAYLTDKEGNLSARTIAYKGTKTYSAVYGTSMKSCIVLEEHLRELGYKRVDCSGELWTGAKLKVLKQKKWCYDDYDDESILKDVYVIPYLDFWDDEVGYIVGDHIILSEERIPNKERVYLSNAGGYTEVE